MLENENIGVSELNEMQDTGMSWYKAVKPLIDQLNEDSPDIIFSDPKSEIIEPIKYYRLGYDYLFLAH